MIDQLDKSKLLELSENALTEFSFFIVRPGKKGGEIQGTLACTDW